MLTRHTRRVLFLPCTQYTSGSDGGWELPAHTGLPEKLLNKSTQLTGFFLPHYAEHFGRHLARLHALTATGQLHVAVDPTPFVGLEAVSDAVEHLHSGRSVGKVVVQLTPSTPPQLHTPPPLPSRL